MVRVIAVNLSPDLAHAAADLGEGDFGELDAGQLHAVLEAFRHVDAAENHDAEPLLRLEARTGKFLVRTDRGKLFLYDARDTSAAPAQLDADGVVRAVDPASDTEAGRVAPEEPPAIVSAPAPARRWIAASLLLLALLIDTRTFYVAMRSHPVATPTTDVIWLSDPGEMTAIRQAAAGHYATGRTPGSRTLTLTADGQVRFGRVLAAGERIDLTDRVRIGREEKRTIFATDRHGRIAVENIDTLRYFGDVYERTP